MAFLVFLAIGLGMIGMSQKASDDVSMVAGITIGILLMVWGFAIAPLPFQLAVEIFAVLAASSLYTRYRRYSPPRFR
ncbi:MAG: hypothetical protein HC769_15630 [Cyanobacteria bacterium CRU_2_1]|nr:hypothetical protein [Cyanobacteria bacterium CRU_2_1]